MAFKPGVVTNPNGRPKRGQTVRDLIRNHPIKDKRKLVAAAYQFAIDGDVHWAEWIIRNGGEGASPLEGLADAAGILHVREVLILHDSRDADDPTGLSDAAVDLEPTWATLPELSPGTEGGSAAS